MGNANIFKIGIIQIKLIVSSSDYIKKETGKNKIEHFSSKIF